MYSDHSLETFTRKRVRLRSALRDQESLGQGCCYERYSDIITKLRSLMQQLEHADTPQPTRLSGKGVHTSPLHHDIRCRQQTFCK